MSTLDAKVITEPSGAWNAAQSLTSISTTVSTAGEDISSAHNQVASDCTSETTNAALSSLSSQRSTLDALSTNTTSLATALTAFGNSMNSIKTRLAQVVADAAAAELVVSGSTIHSPDDPSDEKYETKKAKFDELKETLYLIRQDESSAHDTLISACDSLKSAGEWFRDKYLPTGGGSRQEGGVGGPSGAWCPWGIDQGDLQVPTALSEGTSQCGGLHESGRPQQDGNPAHAVGQDEDLELGEQALHPWHDRLEGAAGRDQGRAGAQGAGVRLGGSFRGARRLGSVQEGLGQPQHGGGGEDRPRRDPGRHPGGRRIRGRMGGGPGWYDDWRRWWPYWHCRRRDYRRGDRRHGRFETRRVSGQCHQQGLA